MPANELALNQPVGTLVLDRDGTVERYSMTEIPADSSSLVREAGKTILDDLDLGVVIKNLRRATDLMFVAYVGTAGNAVRAEISDCQVELLTLCSKSSLTMGVFHTRCGEVLKSLVRCFQELLAGDEEAALDNLGRCARSAAGMAEASRNLADEFRVLQAKTQASHNKTLVAVSLQKAEKDSIERARTTLSHRLVEQKRRQTDLLEALDKLKEDVEDLKAREETESKREFALAIVSAVTGAIGAGLGGYAAAMRPPLPTVGALATGANSVTRPTQ